MYLPNLITIGAMKAGTTSLHEYLSLHPDIYMSKKKEIDFFCHDLKYKRGLNWYKEFFPVDSEIRGESSQNYSKYHWWKDVPKRIHKDLSSDTKFIYILRDPLDRIYSHYNEMQAQNVAPKSLEEYILKDLPTNEIVLTSCYKKQLDYFLKYFPLSSFKIITLEDLKKDRLQILNQIFDFLDVKEIHDDQLFNFSKNTSKEKTMRTGLGLLVSKNPFIIGVKKRIPKNLKDYFKSKPSINKVLNQSIDYDIKMSDKTENKLKEIFKKDTEELRKLTCLKFKDWCV